MIHRWLCNIHVALLEFPALTVPAGLATRAETGVVGVDSRFLTLHELKVVVARLNEVVALPSISHSLRLLILWVASIINL